MLLLGDIYIYQASQLAAVPRAQAATLSSGSVRIAGTKTPEEEAEGGGEGATMDVSAL
jgi:hypothetical protein